MNSIAFIDTEIEPKSQKILDIGSVKSDGSSFHSNSVSNFIQFLNGTQFICGHNILNHDFQYIQKAITDARVDSANIIDTLFLSPLLFPSKPYHALLKDDKLQTEDTNNPLNDAIKAPRGYGWVTNPKKFVYNKVYNKTSSRCMVVVLVLVVLMVW